MKVIKRNKNPKNKKLMAENDPPQQKSEDKVDLNLSKDVDENIEKFKAFLGESTDIVFRKYRLGMTGIPCALVYVDGLIDKAVIHDSILRPMMYEIATYEGNKDEPLPKEEAYNFVKDQVITVADIKEIDTLDEATLFVMSGEVCVIVDGFDTFIIVSARGWPTRSISEPETESVLRGPREGFTETLRINTALLRRKVKDPNMVIKTIKLGRRSKQDVAYVYIKGITNPNLIEEVEKRLNEIDIDSILDTGKIEQLIEDNEFSPFPQIQVTERPDKTVANLMEGRIAILVDNSPFAILVPTSFHQFFQSPEDYYERWITSSIIRALRWIASFMAVFTPAIYVAAISYHPGFIPTELALSIAASRIGVPFPAFLEALLMEITLELLRESGARLPKGIGQTIGIVGGLVIGDAAVRAGFTSPIMVIIVAITAIASFVVPTYSAAIGLRFIRFPIMVLSSILGLYGVMIGFIIINIHLVSLKSFGVNYMMPQAPTVLHDWKDFIIRFPFKNLKKRPLQSYPIDIERMDD